MTAERVICDGCGCKASLRVDGTYGQHGFTQYGQKVACDRVGTPHARHAGDFHIVKRDPNVWMCQCRCGDVFLGPEYSDVESQWVDHRAEVGAGAS